MVTYTVKADRAGENVRLVQDVFAQLAQETPEGLRYTTFKKDDGVSFVHLAIIETEDGKSPVAALTSFKKFTQDIAARCEVPPKAVTLEIIGNYRLL